jgi:hypothetical protein
VPISGLVDDLVGGGPGLLSSLAILTGQPGLFARSVLAAAHLIGSLYPDGTPMVTNLGPAADGPYGQDTYRVR